MTSKRIEYFIGGLLMLIAGIGCSGKTLHPPAPADTGVVLTFVQDSQSMPGSTDALERIPEDRLHTAMMDLETFRLFCAHFKGCDDQATISAIKQPTLDYIRQYIDPILLRRHQLQDDDYSRKIITIYYSKAYLSWIFGAVAPARNMVAQMRKEIPEPLQRKTILQGTPGEIALADALQELDNLIAGQPPAAEGMRAGG